MESQTLDKIKAIPARFLLESKMPIPKNAVSLLSATGGLGKTRYALICASKHIEDTGEEVALWLTEDYKSQVRYTFDELCKAGLANEKSMNKMHIILESPPQLAKRENGIFKADYEAFNIINECFIPKEVRFAIFDPLLAFYGGNENDNSEARVFIQTFAEWAKKSETTVLIIHHANKGGESRGAGAFSDGVRCRYELSAPLDNKGETDMNLYNSGLRILKLKKDNWGVSKPFYKMADGKHEALIRISPPFKESVAPVEIVYEMGGRY